MKSEWAGPGVQVDLCICVFLYLVRAIRVSSIMITYPMDIGGDRKYN